MAQIPNIHFKQTAPYSTTEQTIKINKLFDIEQPFYTVADIFNMLPHKITYNKRVGYLRISPIDICWSSLETETEGKVVYLIQYLLNNENIFDGFIKAIEWINNENVEIMDI